MAMANKIEAETTPPLLPTRQGSNAERRQSMLAFLIGRGMGRSSLSILVRETAAQELEKRRTDWCYTKPVVALVVLWNMAFVVASIVVLICSTEERPNVPIRVWICVYELECLVYAVLYWAEYRIRRRNWRIVSDEDAGTQTAPQLDANVIQENNAGGCGTSSQPSVIEGCEAVNTLVSCIWLWFGYYWVLSGGEGLLQSSPHLFRLAIAFLVSEMLYSFFRVIWAGLIGISLCCCLPHVIGILYAVSGQKGASDADIGILPKYIYEKCDLDDDGERSGAVGSGRMVPIDTRSGYLVKEEGILLRGDAECCICVSSYKDGIELHALPCGHHFHGPCIVKWLKMNATCPLCKFNILKGNDHMV